MINLKTYLALLVEDGNLDCNLSDAKWLTYKQPQNLHVCPEIAAIISLGKKWVPCWLEVASGS